MSNRGRILLYLGIPLLCFQALVLFFWFKAAEQKRVDLRGYYAAGQIIRTGQGPSLYEYDTQRIAQGEVVGHSNIDISNMRFVAPPFAGDLFVPISFAPFMRAYGIVFVLNLAATGAALVLTRSFLPGLNKHGLVIPALLFSTSFPLATALGQGQLSILLLLIFCGASLALQRNLPFLAGFLISLALMKFQIALPVAFLFLLWRKWKFIGGFLIGSVLLMLISLATMGVTHVGQLHTFFVQTLAAIKTGPKPGLDPESTTNLYGLAFLLFQKSWAISATLLGSVLLLLWASRKAASLPFALIVALCVSVHLFIHDLTLLLLPLSVLLDRQMQKGSLLSEWVATPPKRRSYAEIAGFFAVCMLLAGPLQLMLKGMGWLPLLAIPILVLTVIFPSCARPSSSRFHNTDSTYVTSAP